MPQVVENKPLAEAYKRALTRPDPDRYPTSVSDVLGFCEGKVAAKEWPDYAPAFNAKLQRGLQAEFGIRRAEHLLGALDTPLVLERDGIVGHLDGLATDFVIEIKSTDWTGKRDLSDYWLEQNMAYCKLAGVQKGVFVVLYNRANDGFGDISIFEVTYTQTEIDRNWKRMLRQKERVEKVRAWAKEGGPRRIPEKFRHPRGSWECQNRRTGQVNCSLKRDGLCEGVAA